MKQHFLKGVKLNMLFVLILTLKSIILSKHNSSTKGLNSETYPIYIKINLLSLLFSLILKIRNHLLLVINAINLFVVLR